jgi:DNA-3-methyladenine glycosylase I
MAETQSYCEAVQQMEPDSLHRIYHDQHYGFPIDSDNELFGRLLLEINQAGLSWTLILNKQENFRRAYANFDVQAVAAFDEHDRERLLNDAGIIRNKLKVNAAIHNASKSYNFKSVMAPSKIGSIAITPKHLRHGRNFSKRRSNLQVAKLPTNS